MDPSLSSTPTGGSPTKGQRGVTIEASRRSSDVRQAGANLTSGGGMECSIYQNYGAAEVMVQGLAGMVDQTDVEAIVRAQKKMLQRFEKTNEMLANCNHLSSARLERASRDFKGHTQHVTQLKKDLDSVFKRIRALKVKVASQHPEAYAHVLSGLDSDLVDGGEEDDEYDVAIKERRRNKAAAAAQQGAVKDEPSPQSPDMSSALKSGRISPIAEAGVDS